jgi:hypothetical protein
LPDGLFSNQKSQFGKMLEDLGMENVCKFYDHLEYFTAIWYKLWPFGLVRGHLLYVVCGHLVYFFPIWHVWTKKYLATLAWPKYNSHFFSRERKIGHVYVHVYIHTYVCRTTATSKSGFKSEVGKEWMAKKRNQSCHGGWF